MHTEDTVYQSIEQAIFQHKLEPGTRLQEVKLSTIYNVKRGLIRKVLTRLSHAKLVQIKANLGAQVASPSLKEAKDLFATRCILEKAVVQSLCDTITPEQIIFLEDYIEHEEKKYQLGLYEEAKQLSANFHIELANMTENQVLIEYITDISKRTPLIMLKHAHSDPSKICVNDEHRQLVIALKNNDKELAKMLMDQHLKHLSQSFKQSPSAQNIDLSQALNT